MIDYATVNPGLISLIRLCTDPDVSAPVVANQLQAVWRDSERPFVTNRAIVLLQWTAEAVKGLGDYRLGDLDETGPVLEHVFHPDLVEDHVLTLSIRVESDKNQSDAWQWASRIRSQLKMPWAREALRELGLAYSGTAGFVAQPTPVDGRMMGVAQFDCMLNSTSETDDLDVPNVQKLGVTYDWTGTKDPDILDSTEEIVIHE